MKFEYEVYETSGSCFEQSGVLNRLGEQGWELVSVIQGRFVATFYLKRMVPTFGLEPNPPRYEGGIPPANTSRA